MPWTGLQNAPSHPAVPPPDIDIDKLKKDHAHVQIDRIDTVVEVLVCSC